jgi:hypothetical protein
MLLYIVTVVYHEPLDYVYLNGTISERLLPDATLKNKTLIVVLACSSCFHAYNFSWIGVSERLVDDALMFSIKIECFLNPFSRSLIISVR